MTQDRKDALNRFWAATTAHPARPRASKVSRATIDGMVRDGLIRQVRGGYVLTAEGHKAACMVRFGGAQ